MPSFLRASAIALFMFGATDIAGATDATGKLNRGADEATRPPSGAPAGVMQQSGAGTVVRDVPARNTPSGAFPESRAAAPDATTDPNPTVGAAPAGPIGATGETMPAKFSAENAALDKMPIMGHPLPLTDAEKRFVYEETAADTEAETRAIDTEPANVLPSDVKLHDLPAPVVTQVPALKGYKFVKLTDKIVIVSAPNRIVVGEISK